MKTNALRNRDAPPHFMTIFLINLQYGTIGGIWDIYDAASAKHFQRWIEKVPEEEIKDCIQLRIVRGEAEIIPFLEFKKKTVPLLPPAAQEKKL